MQESSLTKKPKVDVKYDLDYPFICEESKKATMQLKGSSRQVLMASQQKSSSTCWEKGTLLWDLGDAGIVAMQK